MKKRYVLLALIGILGNVAIEANQISNGENINPNQINPQSPLTINKNQKVYPSIYYSQNITLEKIKVDIN